MRNFEANRWLTVGEAMREIEKLEGTGYHTIHLGDAGYHDVECDGIIDRDRLQTALLEVIVSEQSDDVLRRRGGRAAFEHDPDTPTWLPGLTMAEVALLWEEYEQKKREETND